jgi:putative phage-type endonuclease
MIDVTINRNNGIGGSECAAAIGLSRYKSPLQVYLDKTTDDHSKQTTMQMELGTYLEPFLIQKYEEISGNKCEKPQERFVNSKCPWLFAHIDSWIKETNLILEAKTTRFFDEDWGEDGTDFIPQEYLIQVAHYCIVCDEYKTVDGAEIIALSRSDSALRRYFYKRNKDLEDLIIEKTKDFWENNVLKQIAPAPKNSEDVKRLYKTATKGLEIIADNQISNKCNDLFDVKAQIKELENKEELLKNEIQEFMKESEILIDIDGTVLATWKNRSAIRIDTKRLKEEKPEIYNNFCKTSENRVFLFK